MLRLIASEMRSPAWEESGGRKKEVEKEEMGKSVNFYGLVIRIRRVLAALLLIVFGIAFVLYGFLMLYIDQTHFKARISDEEVIARAKKLGMIDLKEYLLNAEDDAVDK